jgi:hypothetical protein
MGIMPRPNSKNGTEHLTSSHAERDNKILESEGRTATIEPNADAPIGQLIGGRSILKFWEMALRG